MVAYVKVMSKKEVSAVLASPAATASNAHQNQIIARLAICCGLRVSEIARLDCSDVELGDRPHLRVVGKGGRRRVVPLHWDRGTLAAIAAWKELRISGPLVCSLAKSSYGKRLSRRNIQRRWTTALKRAGVTRRVSIHCGRHTFCTFALLGGKSLIAVRDAAGHANVSTTSHYLHLVEWVADLSIGDLFDV